MNFVYFFVLKCCLLRNEYWGCKHHVQYCQAQNAFMQESYTYIHTCMGVLVVLCAYVSELHG